MAHLFLVEGGHCQWSVVELGSEEGESALHSEGVARSMTGAEVLGGGGGEGEGEGGEGILSKASAFDVANKCYITELLHDSSGLQQAREQLTATKR